MKRAAIALLCLFLGSWTHGQSYTGPLDAVPAVAATECWALRACGGALAASSVKIINVTLSTNSHTCDILSAANGTTDEA